MTGTKTETQVVITIMLKNVRKEDLDVDIDESWVRIFIPSWLH